MCKEEIRLDKVAEFIKKYRHDESMTPHRIAKMILTTDTNSTFYIKDELPVVEESEVPKRKEGFYWVRFKDGDWVVAHWFFNYWIVAGSVNSLQDDYFLFINENKIANPEYNIPVVEDGKEAELAIEFHHWMIDEGWELHSTGTFYYRSKNMHDWPPDETCLPNEIFKQFKISKI